MGFLDSLFGGGEKAAPKKPKKAEAPAASAAAPAGIPAEHIAVIAAAVAAYMGSTGAVPIVKIRRGLNVWAMTGRQEAMDARKF
jgi:hypothetical protein